MDRIVPIGRILAIGLVINYYGYVMNGDAFFVFVLRSSLPLTAMDACNSGIHLPVLSKTNASCEIIAE